MDYKICRNTYHMFHVIGGEDVYSRSTKYIHHEEPQTLLTRKNAFKSWLDKKGKENQINGKLEDKARTLLST